MHDKKRKILIDINHPAHVHFFKNPIRELLKNGHSVIITSREKEFASELLAGLNLGHRELSSSGNSGLLSLLKELVVKDYRLYRLVKQERPDVLAGIGGTFIAHAGFLTGTKSLVFYDTEIAKLQNIITYPFCTRLFVPDCYAGRVPGHKTTRYKGYHELSYLRPEVFTPSMDIAIENGLMSGRKNYFIRLVSWTANHDTGYGGITQDSLKAIVHRLAESGNIIISSEKRLPGEFAGYIYRGNINQVHHVLAFCDCYIGESATMASESAALGVPAIYMADSFRGYVDDIGKRYGLIKSINKITADSVMTIVEDMAGRDKNYWTEKRSRLLEECVNVSDYVVDCIINS
jgi:predicted glycosyltransferase